MPRLRSSVLAAWSSLAVACAGRPAEPEATLASSAPDARPEPPPRDPSLSVASVHDGHGDAIGVAFVFDARGLLLGPRPGDAGAHLLAARFGDGTVVSATLVGAHRATNLAVFRLDASDRPALPLGDSDAIAAGSGVVAVEAVAEELEARRALTVGKVSKRGPSRDVVGGLDGLVMFDVLHTDIRAVMAGADTARPGVPFLSMRREVIGIGIGQMGLPGGGALALPINVVKQLLPRLLAASGEDAEPGSLGAVVDTIRPELVERFGLPDVRGARVVRIMNGGPAEGAGFLRDDVIVAVDGRPVESPQALAWWANILGPGRATVVRVVRAGKAMELPVTLGARGSEE